MRLERIITLANASVRLRFLAMERSLRAVGCDLPLWVIPYGDGARFQLPVNAEWWELPEMSAWLRQWRTHPTMRKYQCLTVADYQFVDSDVVFLRNPAQVLAGTDGFVTSCGHWHNPQETTTEESEKYLRAKSTTWQRLVFNTGQFACDRPLFTFEQLKRRAESDEFRATCLTLPFNEQPGVDLLVISTGVPIQNLTLTPYNMQSAWAGDYDGEYRSYWRTDQETPYLIHWAGVAMEQSRPINDLFYQYLTDAERSEWNDWVKAAAARFRKRDRSLRSRLRRLRRASKAFLKQISSSRFDSAGG
jgi:hypothetical protein